MFFICFAFISALEEDLLSHDVIAPQDAKSGIQSILLNSLDYIRRSVRCLLELINQGNYNDLDSKVPRSDSPQRHHQIISKTETKMNIK